MTSSRWMGRIERAGLKSKWPELLAMCSVDLGLPFNSTKKAIAKAILKRHGGNGPPDRAVFEHLVRLGIIPTKAHVKPERPAACIVKRLYPKDDPTKKPPPQNRIPRLGPPALGYTRDDGFYESREWKQLRYLALKNADGRCKCCGRSAKDGIVLHVDHIKPRYKFPGLSLVLSNLQVLCGDCNLGKGAWDQTDWR